MDRRIRWTLVAVAGVVVVAAVTVAAAQRGGSQAPSAASDCSQYEGHAKERCEAAQRSHRQERIRRHCADNPDDSVCQRASNHSAERMRAHCREHPDDERCTQ